MKNEFNSPIRILLVGFGRMGISHLSIISGLLLPRPIEVVVVDNNLASRILAKELLSQVKVFKDIDDVKLCSPNELFDFCLITTPPIQRQRLLTHASRLAKAVFIEKPLMVKIEKNQMSGYVLQHAPLNSKVYDFLKDVDVTSIRASLITNLSFINIEKGWRSGKFGSVLYEFGGHLLTLIAASCGNDDFLSKDTDLESVNPIFLDSDLVKFEFKSQGIEVFVELKAGSSDVRKASYFVEFFSDDKLYTYDLYSFVSYETNTSNSKSIPMNIAAIDTKTPFYVRGFEFSGQMEAFINNTFDILSNEQINNIEQLVNRVA